MKPAEILLVAAASGVIAALISLTCLVYYNRPITFVTAAGVLNSFASGFVFTLLVLQWGFFYLRFTYILALVLVIVSLAYSYWGMYKDMWQFYLFAAVTWIYIIVLVVLARALELSDPFLI